MSDDVDAAEFARLWEQTTRPSKGHVETRRQREARAMSPTTARRARRNETKTVQLNMRVTPSFRKKLSALATAEGLSIVELIELAIEQRGMGNGAT